MNNDVKLLAEAYKQIYLAENISEDDSVKDVIYAIEEQKEGYRRFDIDYSKGMTFSNNLLALYGMGRRGPVWLTDFELHGNPMPKDMIIKILKHTGLGKVVHLIPDDYEGGGEFKGTHA